MSDASSTDAGSLAKEFLQNGPSNSPPLQFPADPTLLEQVSQALEAIGHLQPTGALVSAVALKVVESGLANPYKPMLVMALAVETLGKLTESENGEALAELAKTASGVLEQKSADVERQSVAEVQSAASELPSLEDSSSATARDEELPQRIGDHYSDMIYNPRDRQWHLPGWPLADWLPPWLGGGGLIAFLAALVVAIFATLGFGTSLSQCSLSSSTQSDQTSSPGILRPKSPLTLINTDGAQGAASAQEPADDPLWEAALQRQRMQAKSVAEYNDLVQQHLKIYEERGLDPCNSGWFPGACSTKSGER